jgi:hypothetical protein
MNLILCQELADNPRYVIAMVGSVVRRKGIVAGRRLYMLTDALGRCHSNGDEQMHPCVHSGVNDRSLFDVSIGIRGIKTLICRGNHHRDC